MAIKKNVGRIDSVVRIVLAILLFYFIDNQQGAYQVIPGIFAGLLILSSLNGFCLLYLPFKINTRRQSDS